MQSSSAGTTVGPASPTTSLHGSARPRWRSGATQRRRPALTACFPKGMAAMAPPEISPETPQLRSTFATSLGCVYCIVFTFLQPHVAFVRTVLPPTMACIRIAPVLSCPALRLIPSAEMQPLRCLFLARQIWEKQSSFYTQFKAGYSNVSHNIVYNGPRAHLNHNDGVIGGTLHEHNLIFNSCRESGDHGYDLMERCSA